MKLLVMVTLASQLLAAGAFAQQLPVRVVIAQGDTSTDGSVVRGIERAAIGPNGEIAAEITGSERVWMIDRLASGGVQHGVIAESFLLGTDTFTTTGLAALTEDGAPLWGVDGQVFLEGTGPTGPVGPIDTLVMLSSDGVAKLLGAGPSAPVHPQMATDGSLLLRVDGAWFLHGDEPERIVGPGDAVPGVAGLSFGVLEGRMLPDGRAVFSELDDYYVWSGGTLTPGPIPTGLDEPALRAVQMVSTTGHVVWRGPVAGVDTVMIAAVGEAPTTLGPARFDQECANGGSLDVRNARTVDASGRLIVVENCGIARLGATTDWVAASGDLLPFEGGSVIELLGVNDVAVSPNGNVVVFAGYSQHPTLGSVQGIWRVMGAAEPEFVARAGGTAPGIDSEIDSFHPLQDGMVNDAGEFVLLAQGDDGDLLFAFAQDVVLADLSAWGDAPEVEGGTSVDVTIHVMNSGPSDATDVVLVVSAVDVSGLPDGCIEEQDNVLCDIGTLSVDETVDITFPSVANSITGWVTASTSDANPANNQFQVQVGRYYGFPDECCYDETNPRGFDKNGDGGCCGTTSPSHRGPFGFWFGIGALILWRRRR